MSFFLSGGFCLFSAALIFRSGGFCFFTFTFFLCRSFSS